jgi:hypothetical protein
MIYGPGDLIIVDDAGFIEMLKDEKNCAVCNASESTVKCADCENVYLN